MSKESYIGGMYIETTGGDCKNYAGGDFVNYAEQQFIQNADNGIFYGTNEEPPNICEEYLSFSQHKNIILNFQRHEKQGKFVNQEFEEKEWHIIDCINIKDAENKLKVYIGGTKAENVFISSHGGVGKYYLTDDNGYSIPNPKAKPDEKDNEKKYLLSDHSGIRLGVKDEDWIFSNDIEDYSSDIRLKNLNQKLIDNIESLINIGNMIKENKNLVMGSCNTAIDDRFGDNLKKLIAPTIDVFINRDLTEVTATVIKEGKKEIFKVRFKDFIKERTGTGQKVDGWRRYNKSKSTKTYRNLSINENGVKVLGY